MKRWLSTWALTCLLAMSAGYVEAQDVVLWHAYDDREAAALEEVLTAFEESEGASVDAVRLPFGVLASRLESAVRTGNGPDLFIDAHERLGRYAALGIVQALAIADRPNVEASQLDALTVENQQFGFPLSAKALALYVNRDLVRDDENTLDARLRIELRDGVWPLVTEGENAYYAAPFFHAFGAEVFLPPADLAANSTQGAEALTRLRDYFDAGLIPPEPSGALVARLFGSGQAAYAISGPWLAASLPAGLNYDVVPLPALEGGGAMQPFVTIEGVFRASGEPNATAERLALFLAGEESALIRARIGGQVVSHIGAWDDLAEEGRLAAFRAAANHGVLMPSHPHMSQTFEPLSHAIRSVVRGGQDPQVALADAESRFARAARPLPEEKDTTFGLLLAGALLMLLAFFALQKATSREFRSAVKSSLPAYRYVSVAAVAVLLLVIGPLVVGALMSLFATDGSEIRYVGFTHYAAILSGDGLGLFANGSFWRVLFVTAVWTALNLALHVGLGIGLALLLHRPGLRFRGLYRVLLIVPWAVPNYVTALSWKGMFHSQYGAINAIIEAAGGESIQWFSRFATAFAANITTNVWLGFPFMMVVALGALSAIPKELYEAAKVDGATPFQRLRYITLPMLWPTMIPAIAMGAVWTFNMFNVVFLVSGGEPGGSTE
ncbi:MAG: extracellular solute-binding protein, partial [Polyangiales bacterium]